MDTSQPTKVRRAEKRDIPWIAAELQNFSQFFQTKKQLFGDETYAHSFLEKLIEDHVFFVSAKGEQLTGLISGFIAPHIFNPKIKVLTEAFWWIAKEHRKGRSAYLLFSEFVKFGREHADWITFSLVEDSPIQGEALINRGFKLQEKSFLMEIS